jgi:hypothetical protein
MAHHVPHCRADSFRLTRKLARFNGGVEFRREGFRKVQG